MNIIKITVYPIIALICFVMVAFGEGSAFLFMTIALSSVLLGVASIFVLYRRNLSMENSQSRDERVVAAMTIGLLSLIAVLACLEKVTMPEKKVACACRETTSSKMKIPEQFKMSKENTKEKAYPNEATKPESFEKNGMITTEQQIEKQIDKLLEEVDSVIKAGEREKAENMLISVIESIDEKAPNSLRKRGEAVKSLAELRFSDGRIGEGIDVIDQHIICLEKDSSINPLAVASFHEIAGTLLGNNGAFAESIIRFEKVLEIQNSVKEDPRVIASTHAKLAISHAELNDKSAAKRSIEEAKKVLSNSAIRDNDFYQRMDKIAKDYEL